MPLLTRSIRSIPSTNSIRSIVERFQESRADTRQSLDKYWRDLDADRSITLLAALIKADLHERFQAGERPTAAEYFDRFPELVATGDHALSLVYEEFCLLEDYQADPSVGEFCQRYEPWRDSLVSQLHYHQKFSQIVGSGRPSVAYPAVGDRFASYKLSSILGKGGAAQVYLATDDLGGRQVVLKVSSSVGQEPSILAQIEHRHIVPIWSVAESPELGLKGICMPYRPGVTLEAVLQRISEGIVPNRARFLTESLEISQQEIEDEESGWREFPLTGTYTEAVAWVGVTMAKALAYLHSKHIYHRDIKPANILLAYKEGPLLFDFNLAHSPNDPHQAQAALKGGTLPYMAPEQLKAFLDPEQWNSVAAPADIYALGLVLRELVTGQKPDRPRTDLPLAHAIKDLFDRRPELLVSTRLERPEIPPSMDAIILKCLAVRPEERYSNASELSVDLQRFLKRQPLAYATSRSLIEDSINWIYRRRKMIIIAGLIVAFSCFLPIGHKTKLTKAMVREGMILINSTSPQQWHQASDLYKELAQKYPEDASPLVFLGLSYNRMGMVDLGKQALLDAFQKKNVEAAIQLGLESDPRSTQLKLSLGQYYLRVKKDLPQARRMVEEVLQIESEHYGAWELLGAIDHGLENQKSIRNYQKAIELARKQDNLREAYRICRYLTPALLDELNENLKGSTSKSKLEKATEILTLIDEQIKLLATKQRLEVTSEDSDLEMTLTYTQGVKHAGSAFVHFLMHNSDQESIVREFRLARSEFQNVLQLTHIALRSTDINRRIVASGLQNYCSNQLEELDRRTRVCHLENLLVPDQIVQSVR